MIQVTITLSIPLAAKVEDWLCEQDESRWCLLKERDDQGYYTLQGFYETEEEAIIGFHALKTQFTEIDTKPQYIHLDDKDWQNAYKAYLKPWHSRSLHWVPVWEKENYTVPANDVALYFDAGMAFGTGAHETTQLCAERLLDYVDAHDYHELKERKVIDAGCGSGILAISAKLLGFKNVYGFDIDPDVIHVCQENMTFNKLSPVAIDFEAADLENGLRGKSADILLANIQTEVLIPHATLLLKALSPKGTLVLSGILETELKTVRAAYEETTKALKLDALIDSRTLGEWADLCIAISRKR